jgi:hypothetical protein
MNSFAAVTSIVGIDVSPFAVVGGNNVNLSKDIVVAVAYLGRHKALAKYGLGSLTIGCCGVFVIHFSQLIFAHI